MRETEHSGPGINVRAIAIDFDGLHDFANLLHEEIGANLRPHAQRIAHDHAEGVGFAVHSMYTSGALATAYRRYAHCLQQTEFALRGGIEASEILIAATKSVLAAYGEADTLSRAKVEQVQAALDAAVREAGAARAQSDTQALAAQSRAEAAATAAETHRENHGRGLGASSS